MKKIIISELKEHIPFTAGATAIALIITVFLLIKENLISHAVSLFYIFHPLHILFSSVVSAAIFYKYKNKMVFSIIIGAGISILIGSLSDIILPYIGVSLFNIPISFNLPAIENPLLILGIAILGSAVGIVIKKTKFPHFVHVLISVFASLLYIFAYSTNFSLIMIVLIFIITSISVVIPCCLSDIVFPLILEKEITKKNKKSK
jgi:hypothetical protein